jgi:hypothetical protein
MDGLMKVRTICTCQAIEPTLDAKHMTFVLKRARGSEYDVEDTPEVEMKLTAATPVVETLCRKGAQYLVEIRISQIG